MVLWNRLSSVKAQHLHTVFTVRYAVFFSLSRHAPLHEDFKHAWLFRGMTEDGHNDFSVKAKRVVEKAMYKKPVDLLGCDLYKEMLYAHFDKEHYVDRFLDFEKKALEHVEVDAKLRSRFVTINLYFIERYKEDLKRDLWLLRSTGDKILIAIIHGAWISTVSLMVFAFFFPR